MNAFTLISVFPLFFIGAIVSPLTHAEELFYDFEHNTHGWKCSKKSTLSVSEKHAKSGNHALEWKWSDDEASLCLEFPPQRIATHKNNSTHLGFWLYNETPTRQRLSVQVYSEGKKVCSFWFNLDYQGWRVLGANYKTLNIAQGTTVDKIVFNAPSSSGTLWIDAVKPAFMSSPIQADDQQPWASNPELLKASPQKTRYSSQDISRNRKWLPPFVSGKKIPRQAKEDMRQIGKALGDRPVDRRGTSYPSFAELCKEFDNLGITEREQDIQGPPLEFGGGGMFLPLPNALNFNARFIPVFEKISEAILREQGENKGKAEAIYLTLCRYFLDQGMQEGNNNYGWIGNGYDFRHFPSRVFLHCNLLEKEGILTPMLKGVAHLSMGKEMLSEKPYSSCDQFYNYSPHLPIAILLLPNEAERYQRMRAFKQYMDKVILNDLPVGKDGSIHHHHGHHLSYGGYTPPKMVRTQILPFKGTEFFISPQAHEKLRTLAKATAFQAMHGKLAPNLYLRSGTPLNLDPANLTLPVALLGSPDKTSPVDREIAALYLDSLDGKDTPDARRFREMGISPVRPTGQLSLNLATISIHRRGDWQASAAGMVKDFRGLEIYGWMENNNYGKQSRNGSLFLTVGDKTGWTREGWNWNFWPGATTSVFTDSVDLFEGYTMYSNPNNMGGSVSQNGNGVWGNDFSAHGVSFKKSIFFFDNRITVITTDIASSSGKEIVTTLFQQSAGETISQPEINGKQVSEFNADGKKPTTLKDSLSNFYYIHPGTPLSFRTGEQEWTYFFKCDLLDDKNNPCIDMRKKRFRETPLSENAKYYKPTKGIFHLAYLKHGNNPTSASCAYTILMQSDTEAAKKFELGMASANSPVNILSQSADAHSVYDPATQTTGYVIFNPSVTLPAPLKKVSRPGFVMVRDMGSSYELTVATGDPAQNEPFLIELDRGQTISIHPNYPLSGNAVVHKKK